MNTVDIFTQDYFSSTRSAFTTKSLFILSSFFDASTHFFLLLISVGILIYLFRGYKYSLLFFITLSFCGSLVYFLKNYFNVSRPEDAVVTAFGQSFPSFHATIVTVFFLMIVFIFGELMSRKWRLVFLVFCTFIIFLISFTRVYLGAHWVSDVMFGVSLGTVISYISVYLFKNLQKMQRN